MNVQFRDRPEPASSVHAKTAIADCDIHPARATKTELYPYLAKRWHAHLETYDKHPYQGMMEGPPYPKAQPNASRRDAYPPEGGPQGSSLSFMQKPSISIRTMSCLACSIRSPPGRASAITISPRRSARRSTTGRSRNGPARTAA